MARVATIQDVADKVGMNRSTVSRALKDHPSIPEATRKLIKEAARELDYRANPLVTALMKSRRGGRKEKNVVIAYVTNYPTRYGWRPPVMMGPDYYPGADACAQELGYKLEHFWMAEPGMTPARFGDILWSRGITGILIDRLPLGVHRLELDWSRFSVVALGITLSSPRVHHVGENHFSTGLYSMQKCLDRGYKRIGLVFSTPNDYPRVGHRWIGAYLCQQRRLRPEDHLPIYDEGPTDRERFLAWYEQWRPDSILVTWATPVLEWLKTAGIRVPQDVGVIELRNEQPELDHAGVFYSGAQIGAQAVKTLTGMMNRSELGVPEVPNEIMVPGKWLEGKTLLKEGPGRA
ncbi:LacI family DNA-binding transcriptional regulator [Synoicihabitans lomoniglobus]|uniref:LacI family DNA-binding transcriptional regulator n=1 Tax=Synoicihabitans lomoniglobus TaxID=2909285 RepID=A0AAF0CI99_9BACT|nr:LacI family transcriptional regulator [Opitutaceae bacterium LMO-M01]WED65147.1 LacI family DNA-binding transcriptional regulator [Opitutaceae bacterium LMO-M01]